MSSCCPGHRCKNTGSGYVKDTASSAQAQDLNKQMNDMIAARAAQEAAIWAPPAPAAIPRVIQATTKTHEITTIVYKK